MSSSDNKTRIPSDVRNPGDINTIIPSDVRNPGDINTRIPSELTSVVLLKYKMKLDTSESAGNRKSCTPHPLPKTTSTLITLTVTDTRHTL